MGTIPTIQLKYTAAGSVAMTPGGQLLVQGSYGNDTYPFSDESFAYALTSFNIITFDVYEDGAPMVDGRVFQVPHFLYSAYPATSGPTQQIARAAVISRPSTVPVTACVQRINVPVYYDTSDNGWTLFYWEDTPPKVTAELYFMRGRFVSLLDGSQLNQDSSVMPFSGIGPGMIPLFIDAADLALTEITNYDSSQASWCLATTQAARNGSGLQYSYFDELCPICDIRSVLGSHTTNNTRSALNMTGTITAVNPGVGVATAKSPIIDIATSRTYSYFQGNFPRTYRRGDASATYDWPGYIIP